LAASGDAAIVNIVRKHPATPLDREF